MLKYWSGREQLVMIPEGGCSAQCAAGCYAVLHVLQSRARGKLCINVLPSPPPPLRPARQARMETLVHVVLLAAAVCSMPVSTRQTAATRVQARA